MREGVCRLFVLYTGYIAAGLCYTLAKIASTQDAPKLASQHQSTNGL